MKRVRPQPRAFTLVELIATMVVLSIIGLISAGLIDRAGRSYATDTTRAEIYTEADAALEFFASEVRAIARASGGPQLWSCTPTFLGYSKSDTGAPQPYITYDSTAQTLSWGQIAAGVGTDISARILASNVSSCTIAYYTESNAALSGTLSTAQRATVRRIEITLTITRSGQTVTLRTRAFPRCMSAS